MRLLYFILLIILVISCNQEAIKIKNSDAESGIVKRAYIRTTEINIDEDAHWVIKEPEINIVSPKDGEMINNDRIVVRLNVSNFKLVTPDRYPKNGQGHVQVWVNDMEFRGSKTEFIFENESNGTYIIKAELMLSNNTVLPYSKTIKVIVNKT